MLLKKVSVIVGIVFVALLLPVLAMSISSTRNIILGLAPDEAVLQLADQIDTSRLENDQKIKEMESLIETQRSNIDSLKETVLLQEQELKGAKAEVGNSNAAIEATKATIAKEKDCSIDRQKYCVSDSFTDPAKFKKFLDKIEGDMIEPSKEKMEKMEKKYTEQFNNCQAALKCE